MSIVVCRAKTGGWTTTVALALAACWPDPRWAPVVEADPSGGSLAARFRLPAGPGLVELAAGSGADSRGSVLRSCVRQVSGCGVDVVAAPVSPRQATAAISALSAAPHVVDVAEGLTLLDVGHLAPGSVTWPLAAAADGVLVCAAPTLDALAAGIGLLDELRDAAGVTRRWLAVCGDGPYRLRDVQQTVAPVPVIGHVPFDLRAVRDLTAGGGLPPRSALARGARQIAEHVAQEVSMPSARADDQTSTASEFGRPVAAPGGLRPAAPAYLEMYDSPQPGALSSNGHGHRQGGRP